MTATTGGGALPLRFLTSAPDVRDLPPSRAEVAVAGRSNVGKSSLLNAVAGRRDVAKVSGTPGRTRLLNCFAVEDGRSQRPDRATVVDLPGYGYAATSAAARRAWHERMERYLVSRRPLALTLLLVDGEIGPTRLDLDMLSWLRGHDVPFALVATKDDKVKSSRRVRRRRDLAAGCGVAPEDVLWVSAHRDVGVDRLRALVRRALADDLTGAG